MNVFPVILSGGSGKRLWPLSSSIQPKQFLKLFSNYSLFQEIILKTNQLNSSDLLIHRFLIVTNLEHRFLVVQQLKEISIENYEIILEPVALNTAPALTFAANMAVTLSENPVLIVLPCDQYIESKEIFLDTIYLALSVAIQGSIVTLGIEPDFPHTGYGYLKVSPDLEPNVYDVLQFVEKPKLEKAKLFIREKTYKWNSGIFILLASTWLDAISFFEPNLSNLIRKSFDNKYILHGFVNPGLDEYIKSPNISIDFSVMEKCVSSSKFSMKMILLNTRWTDLGNYESIWKFSSRDNNFNAIHGNVLPHNTTNSFLYSSDKLIVVSHVNNIIVVETSDEILVANIAYSETIKDIVNDFEILGKAKESSRKKVLRPWGYYEILNEGLNFKVKRISIKPQASLSLQSHKYRSEHWVVVKGSAYVSCENKTFNLQEGESTFIPINARHRLSNTTDYDIEIIEVASGSYLGEDDILRFEDEYGRAL